LFRSANPVLSNQIFTVPAVQGDVMTVQGTVTKSLFVILVTMAAAVYVWNGYFAHQDVTPLILVGAIGGTVVACINLFRRSSGFITTPLYAAFEGLFLGGISATYEVRYPGLVINAIALTFGTLLVLLLAYKARIVQATQGFRAGIFAATGAIGLVYLVDFVLMFFHTRVPFIHDAGPVGIAFSLFVVAIAALNLVLDFDFIERGAQSGAPKQLEWYGAFGLLVTLIWLYLEILRLLAKLQGGNRSRRVEA
jgi:uncharacterized YccA/Bax inhibitor family protein